MRKSEIATVLLVLPSFIGYLLLWQLTTSPQGHMPTLAGLATILLQIGGLLILRFVLPLYALCMFFWGRRGLDIRALIHLGSTIALSIVAWTLLEIPM